VENGEIIDNNNDVINKVQGNELKLCFFVLFFFRL
jgi:hypothetical protein